ncbi:MAG TPA: FkbM family methyltransferase [Alphaproteobacteria bacterium]|nr:FkbM family methyltransferase [Alphaproteobacteria bacterium]
MGLPPLKFLFYFSHRLRHHPFRFLIKGKMSKFFSPTEAGEEELCRRSWPGPIWDIGASLGKYTPMMAEANPNQRIYAFEPNLNSLYYLGYRTAQYKNVVIVPAPLTVDAKIVPASYDPNFHNSATGPQGIGFTVEEAIRWFGVPAFVKLDCEGLEYEMLERCATLLKDSTVLVEWHPEYPEGVPNAAATKFKPNLSYWRSTKVSPNHTLLEPIGAGSA